MELEGRTVIVTGAGSGIGRALALEFARHGARLVCCGRRQNRLAKTVRAIKAQGGVGLAIATDVTKRNQVQSLVKATLKRFGRIDVLFNNAGSFQSIAGVHEVDPKVWWNDVTVNLLGSLLLIREVLPHMLARDEGIIINMDGGRPLGGTSYASSKAGLMELTRVLAEELKLIKSSAMVFGAAPGLVRTEMTEYQVKTAAGRKWIPRTKQCFESGKIRQPGEIARATIALIKIARPELNGKYYDPDTDFSTF
jgi:NAD(P)-dependent dehydrogenase (short-subunit alcohol dehydrogenase family)